jgi:L-threonylcarbamoyladenylate synthase
VAFPTETVYGLGARALDERAIARVFAAKARPKGHPLIAHVDGEASARALAAVWPERASVLARAFWPGPLTIVVARAPCVPAAIAGGGDSIAVRAPSHPVARAVLTALGEPVAAPSANRYQSISPTTAAHVVKSLGDAVALVLDGGPCDAGIESTVVDVRSDPPRVLRPGALSLTQLRTVVPELVGKEEMVDASAPRASPGMDVRHYAPRARMILVDTRQEAERAACGLAAGGAKVGLVVHTPRDRDSVLPLSSRAGRIVLKELPAEPAGYGRLFFSTLHDLDDDAVDAVVVENVPGDDAWWAVADRIRRGAAGGVH